MTAAVHLTLDGVQALAFGALTANGMSPANANVVADVVTCAERDGTRSHGLFRLPGYVSAMRNGRVDGTAVPEVTDVAPGLVLVDSRDGFAPPAVAAGRAPAMAKARRQGIAALGLIRNNNLNALWWDVEAFATEGFIALAMANTRSFVAPWGGRTALFGTDPIAFACPRGDAPPLVFDFATSAAARGEIMVAAREGHAIPEGCALDRDGNPTTDAQAALDGVMLPFGGHKGNAVTIMVELLAAALTGGNLCFESSDQFRRFGGDAGPSNAGELIVVIDPAGFHRDFPGRVEGLLRQILAQDGTRLPGDRRYARRARAAEDGIQVPASLYQQILDMKSD